MNSEAESINNFKFLIEKSAGFGGKFSLFEFRKRKEMTPCDVISWIAPIVIRLLRLLTFERNERWIYRLLDVAQIADDHHGRLLRAENCFISSLHAMDVTLAVFTRQPESGSVRASVGAIPTETANQSERILTIHDRAVGNYETILFACLLPITGFFA